MSDTNGTVRPPLGIRLLHALRKEPDCSSKYPVLFRLVRVSGGAAELPLPARSSCGWSRFVAEGPSADGAPKYVWQRPDSDDHGDQRTSRPPSRDVTGAVAVIADGPGGARACLGCPTRRMER
jgi:hypothetical protein